MAINIITGLPRSGKSLFAVFRLETLKKQNVYVIGNIDGYQFDERCPTKPDEFASWLLTTDWEKKAVELGRKMALFLDESQRNFGTTGMNRSNQNEMFYFLEYHGHYGLDVYLITQDRKNLHERVLPLVSSIYQTQISIGSKNRVKRLSNTWDVLETFEYDGSNYYNLYRTALNEFGNQVPPNSFKALFKKVGIYVFIIAALLSYLSYSIYSKYFVDNSVQQTSDLKVESKPIVVNSLKDDKKSLNKKLVFKTLFPASDLKLKSVGYIGKYDLTKFQYKSVYFSPKQLMEMGFKVRKITDDSYVINDSFLTLERDEEESNGENQRAKSAYDFSPVSTGKRVNPYSNTGIVKGEGQ